MLRHFTRTTSSTVHVAERFGAVAVLFLALSGCSSDGDLFAGVAGSGTGGTSAASAGTEGTLNGGGGFGFVDDLPGSAGSPGSAGTEGATGGGFDGGVPDPYELPPNVSIGEAGEVLCGTALCACNNGVDDDGDGKGDGFDEECTGALDNDEGTFATGIPGDNSDPKWQDCFFDGNSGAGDDHCRYHADCLTGDKAASDPDCTVTTECHDFCEARTPNGCDCFGCCTVQLDDSSSVSVFIGEACSLENVADAASCPRCTPSVECGNTCGECELCPGKGIEDLPASCSETPGGGGTGGAGGSSGSGGGSGSETPAPYTCDAGQVVCGGAGECPAGAYCSLGCCLDFVIY
jgi:hypothetical protein